MVDAERILRFFAFYDQTERKYKSPLKSFLNNYMKKKREIETSEKNEKAILFHKSVELCALVFGNMAFRRWHSGWNAQNPNGYSDSKINEGIFDVQMYGFTQYEKKDIVDKAQTLKDAFFDLFCNPEFSETIEIGTYDTEKVQKRTEGWFSVLREIAGYSNGDKRLYTYEEKKMLFERENGNICGICGNQIRSIEDAHVDHIERYSEGGETVIENAQITHRYCNLSKG